MRKHDNNPSELEVSFQTNPSQQNSRIPQLGAPGHHGWDDVSNYKIGIYVHSMDNIDIRSIQNIYIYTRITVYVCMYIYIYIGM